MVVFLAMISGKRLPTLASVLILDRGTNAAVFAWRGSAWRLFAMYTRVPGQTLASVFEAISLAKPFVQTRVLHQAWMDVLFAILTGKPFLASAFVVFDSDVGTTSAVSAWFFSRAWANIFLAILAIKAGWANAFVI